MTIIEFKSQKIKQKDYKQIKEQEQFYRDNKTNRTFWRCWQQQEHLMEYNLMYGGGFAVFIDIFLGFLKKLSQKWMKLQLTQQKN